ncbi:MAG: hypothetical protein KF850_27905 [Labilithrix sp.]|nr:hypothetical protein [Labilithrix sp.]
MVATIAEVPFHERPVLELLNLTGERQAPDPDYTGYGWARVPRLWLAEHGAPPRAVDDGLLLALHCPDDGEPLADDIELYFELPGAGPVTVLASRFFAVWLPRMPGDAAAIVLALCNPHGSHLATPPATRLPVHYALGEVESWQSRDDGRIELRAPRWHRARPTTTERAES